MDRICKIDDIPEGSTRTFTLDDTPCFLVKKGGELFCFRNSCPHLGVRLDWQENHLLDSEAELIQCATHGAMFVIDTGECVSGPCRGQHLAPIEFRLDGPWVVI